MSKYSTCAFIRVILLLLHSVASSDYTAISFQPMTFSSAPSQMCVSIAIIDDRMVEPNERFTVMLESTDPTVQLTSPTATITILDSCKYWLIHWHASYIDSIIRHEWS